MTIYLSFFQHAFIPLVFDIFGFLASEAVELLKRVQRVMHSNVMTPRSMDVVFRRLGFAIQKGLAAQLVVCTFDLCVIILNTYII
jgi:uncharacterized circularly permuted ATP-grasp superfamily protein